eukprot:TRINITY_DN2507_c0_g1_i1.p1 TRINITY_DN2507_c0_g1~~TRINITY_DN2507_c0_g1_i1.p1  ORF type:complete len:499 (-),score=39.72 TRINITY_DN2507_c0_g1_i1:91-1587(-)
MERMERLLNILIHLCVCVLIMALPLKADVDCTNINSPDGHNYDLSWFIAQGPIGPVKGVKPPQSYHYKFTICGTGFVCGKMVCGNGNSGACQSWASVPFQDHTDEACDGVVNPVYSVVGLNEGKGVNITYGPGDEYSGVPRSTKVYMVCTTDDYPVYVYDDTMTDDLRYYIYVYSKLACGKKISDCTNIKSPDGYTYDLTWFRDQEVCGPLKGTQSPYINSYKFAICGTGFVCGTGACSSGNAGACQSWASPPFSPNHTNEICTGTITPQSIEGLKGGKGVTFVYSNGDTFSGKNITTTVNMVCTEEYWEYFTFNDDLSNNLQYAIYVYSKHACGTKPNDCTAITSTDGYTYDLTWFINKGVYGPTKGISPPYTFSYKFAICGSGFVCGKYACGNGNAGSCQSWANPPFSDHSLEACNGAIHPIQATGLTQGRGVTLVYPNGDSYSGVNRMTTVNLVCIQEDWENYIYNDTMNDELKFFIYVYSKEACGSKTGNIILD